MCLTRCGNSTGHFPIVRRLPLDTSILLSPTHQHVQRDICSATNHNHDLTVRPQTGKQLLQTAIIAHGKTDTAGWLNHNTFIVCQAPATHRCFGIAEHHALHSSGEYSLVSISAFRVNRELCMAYSAARKTKRKGPCPLVDRSSSGLDLEVKDVAKISV